MNALGTTNVDLGPIGSMGTGTGNHFKAPVESMGTGLNEHVSLLSVEHG